MNASARTPLVIEVLRAPMLERLEQSAGKVLGWQGALVCTVDGRQVAMHHTDPMDASRIAAMLGSVVALGDTVCRELKFGRSQSLLVSAGQGHLIAVRVPSDPEVLVLGVLASARATVGLLVHEARNCAMGLAEIFSGLRSGP